MVEGAIEEFIESLRRADEQLDKKIKHRKSLDSDVQVASQHCYVFDRNFHYLYVSLFGACNLGLAAADMEGKYWRDLRLSNTIMETVEANLKQVFSTGTPLVCNFLGNNLCTDYILMPLFDTKREVAAVVCTIRDVVGCVKKRIEAINEIDQLIELSPVGVAIVDEAGIFINVNQAYIKMLSLNGSRDDIVGEKAADILAWMGLTWEKSTIWKALQGVEIRDRHITVGERILIVNSVPMHDCEGNLPGAMVVLCDITEFEKFSSALARLDRLNLVGEMAAGIAHEVRNPMTTVRGFLQMFRDNKLYTQHKGRFDLMIEELDRANSIITEFLSLAKNKRVTLKWGNLNNILATLFPLLQADAFRRGHNLKFNAGFIQDFLMDEKELRQLILNLVHNGIEAMNKKGLILMKTYMEDNQVVLSVQDNGPGIPPNIYEQLGTPFKTTKENGTGLGLSICYRIAERHSGHIEVKTSSQGTTFFIRFRADNPHVDELNNGVRLI